MVGGTRHLGEAMGEEQDSDINIETEHPEFHAWKWATRDELLDTVVTFKRDVYVQVLKEFEAYLKPS